jgi:hypothetical protein
LLGALSSRSLPHLTTLRSHGCTLTFSAPAAGRFTVRWTARSGHTTVVVANAQTSPSRGGRVKLHVVLTPAGRRLVARAGRLSITASSTFAPRAGAKISVSRKLTLSR